MLKTVTQYVEYSRLIHTAFSVARASFVQTVLLEAYAVTASLLA